MRQFYFESFEKAYEARIRIQKENPNLATRIKESD